MKDYPGFWPAENFLDFGNYSRSYAFYTMREGGRIIRKAAVLPVKISGKTIIGIAGSFSGAGDEVSAKCAENKQIIICIKL